MIYFVNRSKFVHCYYCDRELIYIRRMGVSVLVWSIEYEEDSAPIVESDKLVKYCISKGIKSKRLEGCEKISNI